MNVLNTLLAKASLVEHHKRQLEKECQKLTPPFGFLLTVHSHDETSFSIHGYGKSVNFSASGEIKKVTDMTRVAGYLLIQEFKALNK